MFKVSNVFNPRDLQIGIHHMKLLVAQNNETWFNIKKEKDKQFRFIQLENFLSIYINSIKIYNLK